MKAKKKYLKLTGLVLVAIVVVFAVTFGVAILYATSKGKVSHADACTSHDRQIMNCVPANHCAPTPQQDAVIDCAPKDYDSKFNPDL